MGTIVDDPLDFYSDRVPKKQQKRTILEELIEDAKVKKYINSKSFFVFKTLFHNCLFVLRFAKKHYSALQAREEHRRKKLSQIYKNRKAKQAKHSKSKK